MTVSPHLVVSISGHGFGHVAQTAPILNLLFRLMPHLRITVRSAVPLAHLRSRINAPFEHLQSHGDIGMIMSSPLDVCVNDSRTAYQAFHTDWSTRVSDEAKRLRELKADVVFSNVGYLALAGAQEAGIPNAALCSLNWSDIYRHCCGNDAIANQIYSCYAKADVFFHATPGMPMNDLPNLVPVEPIAIVGENKRKQLNQHLRFTAKDKLVLVSMGGIASRLPIERWPCIENVFWLVQESWGVNHPKAIALETLPISFSDLLASCDALVCKPGYGSFVEAACCGTPVLYVNRPEWPETPALVSWLQQHGVCREISLDQSERGEFLEELKIVWQSPLATRPIPNGADQVAGWLVNKLLSN
jgi:hypothetical protein